MSLICSQIEHRTVRMMLRTLSSSTPFLNSKAQMAHRKRRKEHPSILTIELGSGHANWHETCEWPHWFHLDTSAPKATNVPWLCSTKRWHDGKFSRAGINRLGTDSTRKIIVEHDTSDRKIFDIGNTQITMQLWPLLVPQLFCIRMARSETGKRVSCDPSDYGFVFKGSWGISLFN